MQLRAENISFKYNKELILNDVNLTLNSNECIGILAPSGYGKTTLAKILALHEKPISGNILIDNIKPSYNGFSKVQLICQHPQESINPRWKMKKVLTESENSEKEDIIQALGIENEWLERYLFELSGGELQRFNIARALDKRTRFLIADEITSMLDTVSQAQVWNYLTGYAKKNQIGMIVFSHNNKLLDKICTKTIRLDSINKI